MSTAPVEQLAGKAGNQGQPSPVQFFEAMHAYQRTAALKAAIELGLFTAIGPGSKTVPELAKQLNVPERGVRALADYLVIIGFVVKTGNRYSLTRDSAIFLDQGSPAYVGSAVRFLASPEVTDSFRNLAGLVRAGGVAPGRGDFASVEHSVWVDFARAMAPVVRLTAELTEKIVRTSTPVKVLDVAAGHGLFGISVAQHNPQAQIVALDWPSVLEVARENAKRFGVSDRYRLLPGDALEVPFGTGFDVVLAPNLLHHWDRDTNRKFLEKAHAALAPRGRIVVVEFAPNDDRVSPPIPASFVLNMFANTPGGDAYTVSELEAMLSDAGFSSPQVHRLEPSPQTAIVASKE